MLREDLEEAICDNCPVADDCGYNSAPFCDMKFVLNRIITIYIEALREELDN